MPEQYARPLSQSEQHKSRPKIEQYISTHLDGGIKENALDFVAWLRANDMSIRWTSVDTWAANYKGKAICWITIYIERRETIVLPDGNLPSWNIALDRIIYMNGRRQNLIIEEGLQNVFWDNVAYCMRNENASGKGCEMNNECAGGRDLTVLRKEFKNTCYHRSVQRFLDPGESAIEGLKRLLEFEKRIRDDETVKKPANAKKSEEVARMLARSGEQKKAKPTPEELIPDFIADDHKRKAALDLVAFLRASRMNPGWYGVDRWKASNKGTGICFLLLEKDFLRVRLDLVHIKDYEDPIMSAGLQNLVWDHISHCVSCSGCAPGRDMTILGNEFKSLCKGSHLHIRNPDQTTVKGIKRLLELEKQARDENTTPK